MAGPCDHICATGTEEQCAGCLISQGAAAFDAMKAKAADVRALLALAKEKGVVNHAESVTLTVVLGRLDSAIDLAQRELYGALDVAEPSESTSAPSA